MVKLTKKEIKEVQENILSILPPAFEEKKELKGAVSGIKLNAKEGVNTYDPKKMYKEYQKSVVNVNYFEKMKSKNKQGGQKAVFGMFLYYCNKTINTVKAMNTAEKGLLKNMRLVNYIREPAFLKLCKVFGEVAKEE